MIFAVVKSFLFQLVIKVVVVFTLFKIFTSNYSNNFLINYTDEIFLIVVWGIVLHQFLYFDYFKTKIKNLPQVFGFKNIVEKSVFNWKDLRSENKKITYFDYVESIKDGVIILKNKSGLIDFVPYEKNQEQIKHYLKTSILKIDKIGDNGIRIDTKDRLDFYNWDGSRFLKDGVIFFGMDEQGHEIFLELNKMTSYFINGQSGSGKSVFITQLLNGLIHNLDKVSKIFLLDFKGGITFHKYGKISKKIIVGYQLDQLHKIVDYVYKENKRRIKFLKDNGLEKYETDPIFLIFDEWAEVVESCPKKELDKNGYLLFQQTLQKIESLGQLGRSQNVKLVIQTQRGGTDIISSKLRGNLQSRILLRVDNSDAVKMCLGSLDYLEKLGNIDPLSFPYGRFVFLDSSSEKGLKVRYGQGSYIEANEYLKSLQINRNK